MKHSKPKLNGFSVIITILLAAFFAAYIYVAYANLPYNYIRAYNAQQYVIAYKLAKMQASTGDAGAQYCLALCYYYGDGVEQNVENAATWFKKSRREWAR